MLTGELRNRIDKLWEEFWTGGITNPLSVIEQISFLMFARLIDIAESRNERKGKRTGIVSNRIFKDSQQHLRWSSFKNLSGPEMLKVVRDEVFPYFKEVAFEGSTLGEYMADAQLLIQKPSLLVSAVNMIDKLPLTEGDTKGDLYEYLLSKLTTAGINGQFRTPRHIIRLMVAMVDPKPTEIVGDPACGTAGFLVGAMQYLLERFSSREGIIDHGNGEMTFTGDLLRDHREHIQSRMFHGFDFDVTMLRIAAMNLMLHSVESPDIHYQDTLSNSFPEKFPDQSHDWFDVVLANPPFKGSLDEEDVHSSLVGRVKTKKTELLFITLILRMLKIGGRAATIVPDGVLFGTSKAHIALRTLLLEENQLDAVISLPSGVFKPYAGVSTAILVFTKGGSSSNVFFYDVRADGFTLDDKRNPVIENDLPDVLQQWQMRERILADDRTEKAFNVSIGEIRENNYDLSVNRYRINAYVPDEPPSPKDLLDGMFRLEEELQGHLSSLEALING